MNRPSVKRQRQGKGSFILERKRTCCIVSDLCLYTTATAAATKIKERIRFHFRSSTNAPLRIRLYWYESKCDIASKLLHWSDLCIYTTATAVAANIKEKNRFRVRSNIIFRFNTLGLL